MIIHSIARACCFMAALGGGAILSQYPTFVQQYTQRLGGQVDALAEVVADFDASALEAGLTRSAALSEMSGSDFLEARAADMRSTFARHVVLTDQLAHLRNATGVDQIMLASKVRDAETIKATWADFKPSVQVTLAGAITGFAGFIAGWGLMYGILSLLARFIRRTPRKAAVPVRIDPPIARPDAGARHHTPRLMGETRP